MFMVGGFVGYFTLGATGNIVVAVVSAALVVFALGYLTEVALIRPFVTVKSSESRQWWSPSDLRSS